VVPQSECAYYLLSEALGSPMHAVGGGLSARMVLINAGSDGSGWSNKETAERLWALGTALTFKRKRN
jgi:hypothetical protein